MANEPQKWANLLGSGADVNTIPEETPAGTGAASMKSIFPPITQVPLNAGGIAPDRADFNGLFKLLGDNIYYQQQGGVYSYSATIDYAKGSQVKHNDKIYVAIQANGPATVEKEPGEEPDFWQEVVLSNTEVLATGTTTARSLENRFADVVNVKDFGATGDGVTDDTLSIQNAIDLAFTTNKTVYVPKGAYLVSNIQLKKGVNICFDGELLGNGTAEIGSPHLSVLGDNTIHNLRLKMAPALGSNYQIGIEITGANVSINTIELYANESIRCEGLNILTGGDNFYIGYVKSINIDRPIRVSGDAEADVTGGVINGYYIRSYIRGIKLEYCNNIDFGSGTIEGYSTTATSASLGYNAVLIGPASFITFDDCTLGESMEHCIRIGGVDVDNIKFGNVVIRKAGASAIKINARTADPITSAYVGSYNVSFGDVVVVDNFNPEVQQIKSGETLRISHCKNLTIQSLSCYSYANDFSGTNSIVVNNSTNIFIGSVFVDDGYGNLFTIKETNDSLDEDDRSVFSVEDVYINNAYFNSKNDMSKYTLSAAITVSSYNNIHTNIVTDELKKGLIAISDPDGNGKNWYITGSIGKTSTLRCTGDSLDNVYLKLNNGTEFTLCKGSTPLAGSNSVQNIESFTNAGSTKENALFIRGCADTVSGIGAYGGAISFARPASTARKGSAIVSTQTGSSTFNTGLTFFTGGTTLTNESFMNSIEFTHSGDVYPGKTGVQGLGSLSKKWYRVCSSAIIAGENNIDCAVDSTGEGYIRYANGLQICYGSANCSQGGTSNNLPMPFKDSSYTLTATYTGALNNVNISVARTDMSTFTLYQSYSADVLTADYIAIGLWK